MGIILSRFTLAVCSLVLATACSYSVAGERPAGPAPATVIDEFRIARGGDLIVIPVTIGGSDYPFWVDTGASHSLFDVRLQPLLGEPVGKRESQTPGGSIAVPEFAPLPMKVGSVKFLSERPIGCIDLTTFRELIGKDIAGVIGMDFLRRQVLQIDFDEGLLRFLASVPDELPAGTVTRTLLPDRIGLPTVAAYIPHVGRLRFVVDTGDNGSISGSRALLETFVAEAQLARVNAIKGFTAAGIVRHRRGVLRAFELGEMRHQNLDFVEGSRQYIGLAYLSRFKLILDFPRATFYASPGARFNEPDLSNWTGIHIRLARGNVVVDEVDEKTPGERNGVKAEDTLKKVNGRLATDYSLFEIRRIFTQARPVKLVVRRADRAFPVELEMPAPRPADE